MSVRRLHKQEKTEIKIIAESIGYFSASASIVDFGFYDGTWNANSNFASCNRSNANSNLAPFSIIILSLSDVCESTQDVCELAVGETTRLRNDRLPLEKTTKIMLWGKMPFHNYSDLEQNNPIPLATKEAHKDEITWAPNSL